MQNTGSAGWLLTWRNFNRFVASQLSQPREEEQKKEAEADVESSFLVSHLAGTGPASRLASGEHRSLAQVAPAQGEQ